MYNWSLEKQIRLDQHHAENWKSARRCDRPLCGARCRDGHSCKAKSVVNSIDRPVNGKCRMHGGLSSGPKTLAGKEKSREAARNGMLEYWRKKKGAVNV